MLDVLLHGQRVGTLVREPSTRIISLVLEEAYMAEANRPVLGQQFEDRRDHRVFRQAARPGRLPTFFANLLPEGALQAIVASQRLADDEASTLAVVGEDLPGAVVVRPAGAESAKATEGDRTFDEPPVAPSSIGPGGLRFSLAGVQLKFSAVRDPSNRFTLPFRGRGGRWILKFGSPTYPGLPENEHWTMQWAARCGLAVPRNELIDVASIQGLDPRFAALDRYVFAIERYDRTGDDLRIHQEDFAQVRGILPEQKYGGASYEALARFIGDLCGHDDLLEFVRRVVFTIVSGNTDMHLKNWSLVYPDRRGARLAPAYDLVFVRQYLPTDQLALPLVKERDPLRIGWEHFTRVEKFLARFGLDLQVVATAREFLTRCVDDLRTHRDELEDPYRKSLEAYVDALPLVRTS
ncbi:type II toxin-antitoxin system HipA family toxin [Sorangium sp. So ce124]|uniref:type II toxin-antitoxin system HipA family toxin n=1 Tax=Sorangium sp. So ce124 TaxID=3133280 RepID=UPI003F62F69A